MKIMKYERSTGHKPGIVNNPKSNLLNSKQKYVNVNIDLFKLKETDLF